MKLKLQKKSIKKLSENKTISHKLTPAVGGAGGRLSRDWAFTCGWGDREDTCIQPF
ncbi:hypothetical protein PSECIP111951_02310 [Pseudoalteromonas holothuriae]|uniref:Uncharacterized protein n=1 Tax=Pseudoalteromonas holothuriae TaxID=2963714 RepID=A0A9W4W0Q2_9GAMM|nr:MULTISPECIES: hypothetical protein [unclassified Pseudoalteromonas]CAH9060576.1 hypothetical protein PSECIP111951_02310 [Pseudoalteromonas sp. CIP111951]CAH9060749.1 hypothetical protein PSECIP111854_02670 [Pseudoalteromonas sp. CIP111854]